MENEMIDEMVEQEAPKIEKVSLTDIQNEEQEQFDEKVEDYFKKVVEAYQNLSPEEKELVKKHLLKQ